MIPKMGMAVQHSKERIVTQTALLYIRCTEMYSSRTDIALRVPQILYTDYEFRWHPLQQVYDSGMHMAVLHPKVCTIIQTAFSCIRFTDLYSSLAYASVQLPMAVYTNYQVPLRPIQQVYDTENAHCSTTPLSEH